MITQAENRSVIKIGEFGSEAEFSIANSAHAFRVIMGSLYSDKVGAIIRELSSNSYDSHIMAKNKIPFDVYLPSEFEPNFIIRDYGTGISHDFMMTSYTQAFRSTKGQTNDQVGALGLGRLSALSLCDNYTATSFQDGIKRTYSIFINESGKPQIAFLGKEATNEPNGLLVDVPVPGEYISQFDEKAKELYSYYSIRPTIKNRDDFVISENNYLILSEDGSFGLRGSNYTSMAIMGCYCYPLDYSAIPDLSEEHKQLLMSGLVVHFGIGEVDVAANRESLHYNKATIKNIKDKLDLIYPKVAPIVLAHFENKNVFEKMALYNDLLSYNGKLSKISGLIKEMVKKLNIPNFIHFGKAGFKVFIYSYDCYKNKIRKSEISEISYCEQNVFYYTTKKIHLKSKAKKFFSTEDNQYKKIVFIYPLTSDCVDNFKKTYDYDILSLPDAKDLPYDKVDASGNEKVFKTLAFYKTGYRRHGVDCWHEEELNTEDDIIYVTRKGYGVEDYRDLETLQSKIEEVKSITGNEDITVFGLTNRQIKNGKHEDWKTLSEYHKEVLEQWKKEKEEEIAAYKYFVNHYVNFPGVVEKLELDNSTLCGRIYEEYKTLEKIADKVDSSLANQTKCKESDKYLYSTKELKEKYPLLEYIEVNYGGKLSGEALNDLNEYVKNKS